MKKKIVLSAINFFEGGPLSILFECLDYMDTEIFKNYEIVALISNKNLVKNKFKNIEFKEYPKARKSYLFRLFYEYIYFEKIAKKINADFWFSLHDITPNVGNIPQVVYCHNPSPFYKANLSDLLIQPSLFFFSLFYKYLYKKNIKKNDFVIVQQLWLKNRFVEMYNLDNNKVIIARPQIKKIYKNLKTSKTISSKKKFLFPTYPRPFKNIEVIGDAVILLNKFNIKNFKVILTINGSENKYSSKIYNKYKNVDCIEFIGICTREEIYNLYSEVDFLIFPSKLETWGLPISEFKQFNKPILLAKLPYAEETIGDYDKVKFFNPEKPSELAMIIKELIEKDNITFDKTKAINYPDPNVESWKDLFEFILKIK